MTAAVSHAPLGLDSRVVIVSERDWLSLDWALHHSRWLQGQVVENAIALAQPDRFPPKESLDERTRWVQRHFDPEAENARRDRIWANAPERLAAWASSYDAEREWWLANVDSAPVVQLRQAVRQMMAAAGGARSEVLDLAGDTTEDGPTMIRSLRWLLSIRAEVARRRMFAAEALLVVSEAHELGRGNAWAYEHLGALQRRISDARYGDPAIEAADCATMLAVVRRREAAAAAHGTVGAHTAPVGVHYERLGAADTVET